jgi:hypothetical protein
MKLYGKFKKIFELNSEKNLEPNLTSSKQKLRWRPETIHQTGVSPKNQRSRKNILTPAKGQASNFKHMKLSIFFIPLFFLMTGTKEGYSQVLRQVNYCTVTQTYCAIPSCVGEDSITDLDRVRMMYNDLIECTENVIDKDRYLTVTTYFPQKQRYLNDYQYKVGKSVTSVEGTVLYDHEGEEIIRNDNYDEQFILSDEYVEVYGIYNHVFSISKDEARDKLLTGGFQEVYEDEGFLVIIDENVEIAMNFDEFIIEIRFFDGQDAEAGKLKNLHRTNYTNTDDGNIIPVEETMVKYDILPSGIPYEITEVKSYLFYQVIQENTVIASWGEKQNSYDDYLYKYNDYLHKNIQNGKGGDVRQFEEIQKRKTEIQVYPNPAKEQITVVLPFYMNENIDITLYNSLGTAVLSQHHIKGEQIEFDISSLPAGFYIVRCVKNGRVVSTKFVKL